MSYTEHGSFKFGNTDMYDTFGIMLLDSGMPGDLFIPSIRERKVTIPARHGEYDFGAKYYNERRLELDCITANPVDKSQLRSYIREVTYVLSKKSEIRLWNEPDKYYVGRLYDEVSLTQLRDTANTFTLVFTCEPFAYGRTYTERFDNNLQYIPDYHGTFTTPTYIVITNTGTRNVSKIQIKQTDVKENY